MKVSQYKQWQEKTIKLNKDKIIKLGDIVSDGISGDTTGTVVDIQLPVDPIIEGSIEVLLSNGEIEHYAWFNWKDVLRILD
jgi:hypothetical protein